MQRRALFFPITFAMMFMLVGLLPRPSVIMSMLGALPLALLALAERLRGAIRSMPMSNYLSISDVKLDTAHPRWVVGLSLGADVCILIALIGAPAGASECAFVGALGCCILTALAFRRE
jgi:hypothetical protein